MIQNLFFRRECSLSFFGPFGPKHLTLDGAMVAFLSVFYGLLGGGGGGDCGGGDGGGRVCGGGGCGG